MVLREVLLISQRLAKVIVIKVKKVHIEEAVSAVEKWNRLNLKGRFRDNISNT